MIIYEQLSYDPLVTVLTVESRNLLPDLLPKHDEQHCNAVKNRPLNDSHLDKKLLHSVRRQLLGRSLTDTK